MSKPDRTSWFVAAILAILSYPFQRQYSSAESLEYEEINQFLDPLLDKAKISQILQSLHKAGIVARASHQKGQISSRRYKGLRQASVDYYWVTQQIYQRFFEGSEGFAGQTIWYLLTSIGWDSEAIKETNQDIQNPQIKEKICRLYFRRRDAIREIIRIFGWDEDQFLAGTKVGIEQYQNSQYPQLPKLREGLVAV